MSATQVFANLLQSPDLAEQHLTCQLHAFKLSSIPEEDLVEGIKGNRRIMCLEMGPMEEDCVITAETTFDAKGIAQPPEMEIISLEYTLSDQEGLSGRPVLKNFDFLKDTEVHTPPNDPSFIFEPQLHEDTGIMIVGDNLTYHLHEGCQPKSAIIINDTIYLSPEEPDVLKKRLDTSPIVPMIELDLSDRNLGQPDSM